MPEGIYNGNVSGEFTIETRLQNHATTPYNRLNEGIAHLGKGCDKSYNIVPWIAASH